MNNMMRKNNNRGGNKHRGNSGGQRRYNNNGGGGNRGGQNDAQSLQRQKHHATQQLGKYSDLARNAQNNGDRVDVEYYLQHVEHYNRVLASIAEIEAERFAHQRESQIIPGGPNDPNAQAQHHAQDNGGEGDNGGVATSEQSPNENGNADNQQGEGGSSNQPRASRQRRPHQQEPREPSDNGAKEANSNTTEIPLPGGILPPI